MVRDTYTHGHHESVLRSHRWRTAENSAGFLLDALRPGLSLLDVGCGPGTITADLARYVAPGRVVGTDTSDDVLATARAEAAARGADNVEIARGDGYGLPHDDAAFDVVHAHQVLQHLSDPVAALREMRRVCAPEGIVAVRDADYAAMSWYPDVEGLTDWLELYHAVARGNGAEPDAGRRLVSWARQAGFREVTASASVWCHAAPEESHWWGEMWAERIVSSAIADQARERGLASEAELRRLSGAWLEWARRDDAWFTIVHGEVLARP